MKLRKLSTILVGDEEIATDKRRLISLAFMVIAIALAWIPYERDFSLFRIWGSSKTGGFLPNFLTGMIGLAIVLPMYLRNILRWEKTSIYSILSFALNLTLIATLCRIILPDTKLIWSAVTVGLLMAVVLSWLGMRPVALLAWAGVLILGVFELQSKSNAMGVAGFLFVLFGAVGLILHSELKPREIMSSLKHEFRGQPFNAAKYEPISIAEPRERGP